MIRIGREAKRGWTAIAAELNKSGLRPPRATSFTPIQVRLLYLRDAAKKDHGDTSA